MSDSELGSLQGQQGVSRGHLKVGGGSASGEVTPDRCATGDPSVTHLGRGKMFLKTISSDNLLPIGIGERGVFGVGSVPDAKLPSCQYMKNI